MFLTGFLTVFLTAFPNYEGCPTKHSWAPCARERQLPTTNRKVKRTQSEIIPWPALWAHLADLISLTNSGTEVSIREKMKEIIPEYSYQTDPVHVQNEPAENVFSPTLGIARPFAAGAGQD